MIGRSSAILAKRMGRAGFRQWHVGAHRQATRHRIDRTNSLPDPLVFYPEFIYSGMSTHLKISDCAYSAGHSIANSRAHGNSVGNNAQRPTGIQLARDTQFTQTLVPAHFSNAHNTQHYTRPMQRGILCISTHPGWNIVADVKFCRAWM